MPTYCHQANSGVMDQAKYVKVFAESIMTVGLLNIFIANSIYSVCPMHVTSMFSPRLFDIRS